MTRGDVRNFVSHNAGELGLFGGAKDQAAINIEKSAGKSEGVDLIGVDDFDGEGNTGVGIADEILADAVDVFDDDGVIDEF